MGTELFDVIEKDFKGNRVSVIAQEKTKENAEAIVEMAVIRRGVENTFFTTRPTS